MIEPEKGKFDDGALNDVVTFIKTAQEVGLLVILRPGPYICAERDFGGFPVWLQWEEGIEIRTNNTVYMDALERYFAVLLPKLVPLLYSNGGPVIMIQIENEFASFPTSKTDAGIRYKEELHSLFLKYFNDKVVLFTTDGGSGEYVKRGNIPGVFPTFDFGTPDNVTYVVENYRKIFPHGPLVNSEFYTGWLDHWSEKHNTVNTSMILDFLQQMHKFKMNVNL